MEKNSSSNNRYILIITLLILLSVGWLVYEHLNKNPQKYLKRRNVEYQQLVYLSRKIIKSLGQETTFQFNIFDDVGTTLEINLIKQSEQKQLLLTFEKKHFDSTLKINDLPLIFYKDQTIVPDSILVQFEQILDLKEKIGAHYVFLDTKCIIVRNSDWNNAFLFHVFDSNYVDFYTPCDDIQNRDTLLKNKMSGLKPNALKLNDDWYYIESNYCHGTN